MKRGIVEHMCIYMFNRSGNKVLVRTDPDTNLPRSRTFLAQRVGWLIAKIGLRIMLGGKHRWQTVTEQE